MKKRIKKSKTIIANKEDEQAVIENVDESSEINKPFDPTQITITVKPLIIDSLIKRMASNPMRINLNTDFQREGNLWKEDTQSRLIESLLVRIPLPAFYFDGSDDENWKVVDGLQRLYTLKNFVIDKTLKLSKLEYLKQYEGRGFDELPSFLQGRVEETHITAYIINPGTPTDVKYNIFKRINTGGLVLKAQEIRHALNQGIPADFVKELAKLPEFEKATDYALQSTHRMEDRDFVTRFIAFYNDSQKYQSDLDSFLNEAMANLKKINIDERKKTKDDFIKAMKAARAIFGDDAFRKRYAVGEKRKPLNKALFDSTAVNLAKLSDGDIKKLILRKDAIKKEFLETMSKDRKFDKAITAGTGKPVSIEYRFNKVKKMFAEILRDK